MNRTLILLGGNLGNREEYLTKARDAIKQQVGQLLRSSSIYETAAWGVEDQPSFLNQVVEATTLLTPLELLHKLQGIEKQLGRTRLQKWHSRTIDIDILFYGQEIIQHPDLKVPHPEIGNRRFTLVPLAELVPNMRHPVSKKSILEMLESSPDQLSVNKINQSVALPAKTLLS